MPASVRFFARSLLLLVLFLAPGSVYAQPAPSLLGDLNPGSSSSFPSSFVQISDAGTPIAVFAANGDNDSGFGVGRELWKTDGTAAGTTLIRDLATGSASSSPLQLVVVDNVVYFTCDLGSTGRELCRSDGTFGGTSLLKDIRPGTASSNIDGLTAVGDQLFFFADNGTTGQELWASDGTASGTRLVADVYPGPTPLNRASNGFNISLNGRYAGTTEAFFFMANDGTTGLELWTSDGTAAGTQLARDIEPGPNGPQWLRQFTALGSQLVFESYTNTTGRELWISDGTPGGTQSLDVFTGSTGSSPQAITRAGSTVFFFADYVENTVFQTGLFRYTPTEGVVRVRGPLQPGDGDASIAAYGDKALLRLFDPDRFEDDLWVTDGTPGGTFELSSTVRPDFEDVNPSGTGFEGDMTPVVAGGRLYFQATTSADGDELWRTDGTVSGTDLVQNFGAGTDNANLTDLFVLDDTLVLFGATAAFDGNELWSIDETVALPGLPYVEDFETDGDGTRYTTSNTFYDGVNDHFQRTDGVSSGQVVSNVSGPYTGFSGTFFWAGEDLDDNGGDTQPFKTLTLQEVDVSGQSDVRFSGLFAAGCNQGPQSSCYDSPDSLVVRYSVDGGATFQTALQFSYVQRFTDSGSIDAFNEPFARDFNFDGDGEGIELTPAMQRFGFDVPTPASTVIIQLAAHLDGAAEEFAFDDLRIESRPSSVAVVDPLGDVSVPATRSTVVDVRTAFEETANRELTFSAVSSDPSVATVSVSNGLDQIAVAGVAEGTATVDVIATSTNGDEAVDTFTVTVTSAPPEFELDTRIAFAADFCSDTGDPSTCGVIGTYRFSQIRSDTLRNVNPSEPVLVRYVVTNRSNGDFTNVDVTDADRGAIVSAGGPVAAFDSIVVNRIYDAPTATGLALSRVTATGQSGTGVTATRRDLYGIDRPDPEVRMDTRIARAVDFCSDTSDPSTCGVVGEYRFGSPRSDTLSNANPGEKVLVRYIATNLGSTDLTRFTVTDDTRGTVFDGTPVDLSGNPVDAVEPFDSLVVNRIYDAPLPTGLEVTRVDVTAEDGGGNADVSATLYGIDRPDPEVRMDTRIARAVDFCSDTSDPSTCGVVGEYRFGSPRSDTLSNANPGEKVLVRYIATNLGSTDLTRFTVTDDTRGTVFDGTPVDLSGDPVDAVEPFDSLVVNRIYDAPLATGLEVTRVNVAAEDGGGASDASVTLYGIDVPGPDLRVNVRVAFAEDFCPDTSDPSTCGVVGEYRFSSPRSDTLRNVNPGEKVLVRYVATNLGSTDLTEVDLSDSERGSILSNEPVTLAPFDSVVVNRIYDAQAMAGLQVALANAAGRDAGGNEATGAQLYGIDVPTPEVRMNTRIAFAENFCSDTSDPSTCSVVGDYRFGSPRSDTLSNVNPGEKVLVRYIATNLGSTDLTRFTVTDQVRGTIFDGTPVDLSGNPVDAVEPFDSLVVNRIYDAPLATGLAVTRVDVTAEDDGGNTDARATLYGIDRPAPVASMNVRVARAADFCTDVADPSTCGVVGAYQNGGSEPRPDTLLGATSGERVLVRYVATNRGTTDLTRFTVTDAVRGTVFDGTPVDLSGNPVDAVEPFDSLVVNRIYDAPTPPGIALSYGRVEANDAGGNAVTPQRDTYGVQVNGPSFRFTTFVAAASRYCTNIFDVTTCSLTRLKASSASSETPFLVDDREMVVYRMVNDGTVELVRHTLTDDVAGPVFQDNAFTVAPLDSSLVIRLYDDVPVIGESRSASWTAATPDGAVLSASSTEEPLPVELSGFGATVAAQTVTLEWSTASEQDNAGFEVQRYDARREVWEAVTFVEGAGTTAEPKAYRYEVGSLEPDVYRFRLRQIDVSGRFAVSKTVNATVSLDGPYRFTPLAPNPIRDAGRFSLTVREGQSVQVAVYDLLGRRVSTLFDGDLEANTKQPMEMRTGRLASGAYFVRAVGETFAATQRVVVVR